VLQLAGANTVLSVPSKPDHPVVASRCRLEKSEAVHCQTVLRLVDTLESSEQALERPRKCTIQYASF
jgi:hypothetical protein